MGLITNPTGVDNQLRSTIDILAAAPTCALSPFTVPEHGVRGNAHAGDAMTDAKDAVTGLPAFSLKDPQAHGRHVERYRRAGLRHPGHRLLVYLHQHDGAGDGSRSRMRQGVHRTRPSQSAGGERWRAASPKTHASRLFPSLRFLYVHGLTCGELAQMLNGERMPKGGVQCRLKGYPDERMEAPHGLCSDRAGVDTVVATHPASRVGMVLCRERHHRRVQLDEHRRGLYHSVPDVRRALIDATQFADRLNALQIPGVVFRPIFCKPFYAT